MCPSFLNKYSWQHTKKSNEYNEVNQKEQKNSSTEHNIAPPTSYPLLFPICQSS